MRGSAQALQNYSESNGIDSPRDHYKKVYLAAFLCCDSREERRGLVLLSIYSELAVRNGEVNGYIKPLFRETDVYDAHQEGNKPFFTKVREGVVAAAARLLKNRRRDEVATSVTISGRIDSRNLAPGKLCSVSSKMPLLT